MRKRITYIQQPDAPFEFDQTVLNTDALSIRNLDAVRQERVTVGIEEVPVEVCMHHLYNTIIQISIGYKDNLGGCKKGYILREKRELN